MGKYTITTKVRIYPNDVETDYLSRTSWVYVQACNLVSDWIFDNKNLVQRQVHDATYRLVRDTLGLGAQMTASAIRSVIATYKTMHAHDKKWGTKPHFKRHRFNAVYGRDYTFTQSGLLSLGTLYGRIKVAYSTNPHFDLKVGKLGTATIHCKRGKWMLHIPVEIEIPDSRTPQNIVGIDRGIRHLAVAYDTDGSTTFYSGAEVKNKRAHYKQLRSDLQRKQTRSARKRLKSIGNRENRWMRDVNHCVSKALVSSVDRPTLFVLEDLSHVRTALTKVKVRQRYLQVSWAYAQLGNYLMYKAVKNGHSVIEVDPRYTSQTCPKCSYVSRANRIQSNHVFVCQNCGYRSNDDRVAAMNLQSKGTQYLLQSQSGNTCL